MMKKLFKLALSFMMVFSLITVVKASTTETETISFPNNEHTYEVYQIFTGDLSDGILSNIKWGENGTGTLGTYVPGTVTNALEALTTASPEKTDVEELAAISNYVDLTSTPYKTVKANSENTVNPAPNAYCDVTPGYYLIKDKDGTVTGDDAYTLYIVEVVDSFTIEPKSDTPKVEKKVLENSTNTWEDAADYNTSDNVPFKLTATLGDISNYSTYYVEFQDTFTTGGKPKYNTFIPNNDFVVKIDGKPISTNSFTKNETVTDNDYTGTGIFDKYKVTISVSIADVISLGAKSGSVIEVTYSAKLVNILPHENIVKLIYSNNPNVNHSGDRGETPEDKVIVYSYDLTVNKVDGNGNRLGSADDHADFTLYKKNADGTYSLVTTDSVTNGKPSYYKENSKFAFVGLDAGDYKLVETATPSGYNGIEPIFFTIDSSFQYGANPYLKELTIKKDGEVVSTALAGNADDAVNLSHGYWTAASCCAAGITVANYTGATLPETGGRGTTMLYVGGSLLMLGAAILLVSKKRMSTVK